MGGSAKRVELWSKEGVKMGEVSEGEDWVWGCAFYPPGSTTSASSASSHTSASETGGGGGGGAGGMPALRMVAGHNDGLIARHEITFNTVHGLHRSRYAYRRLMTDVVVHDLISGKRAVLKCR